MFKFFIFFVFFIIVISHRLAFAADITGSWEFPKYVPAPRHSAVFLCSTLYGNVDLRTLFTSGDPVPQLFGGIVTDEQHSIVDGRSFAYFASNSRWATLEGVLPTPRGGMALACGVTGTSAVGSCFLFGGVATDDGELADAVLHETRFGQPWGNVLLKQRSKEDPPALSNMGFWASSYGNSPYYTGMFVWGGLSATGLSPYLYVFMSATADVRWCRIWRDTGDGTGPAARYDTACAAYALSSHTTRTHGICFGGADLTRDFNDVWRYETSPITTCTTTNAWTQLHAGGAPSAAVPSRRRAAAVAFVDHENVLFMYGGFDATTGDAIKDDKIWRFHIATTVWDSAWAHSPQDHLHHGAFTNCYRPSDSTNTLYWFGGYRGSHSHAENYKIALGAVNTKTFPAHDIGVVTTFANLSTFVGAANADTRPFPRAELLTVTLDGRLWILWGRNGLSVAQTDDEMWSYDPETNEFQQLALTSADETVYDAHAAGVLGSAAMHFRGSIVYFGGFRGDPTTNSNNNLVLISTTTGEVRLMLPSTSARPPARTYHVIVELQKSIVVGLGYSYTIDDYLDDWWKYDSAEQVWSQLTVVGDAIAARLGSVVLPHYNATHAVVALGIGARRYDDFYFIELSGDKNSQLKSTRIPMDASSITPEGMRVVGRGYTHAAGSGRHMFVCGGASAESVPVFASAMCLQIDLLAQTIKVFPSEPSVKTIYGGAGLVGDKFILFGGQTITPTVVSSRVSDVVGIFKITNLCAGTATTDANCIACGIGYKNTGTAPGATCAKAVKGHYIPDPLKEFVACPAGTASKAIGAHLADVCQPCALGTVAKSAGMSACTACASGSVCPPGSSAELSATSESGAEIAAKLGKTGLISETHPATYEPPPLPWFPILFVSLIALVLIGTVSAVVSLSHSVWLQRLNYFVPEDIQRILEKIYLDLAQHIRGMNEQQFIIATFSDQFPNHTASVLQVQLLFHEINEDGSGAISEAEFLNGFVLLIMRGYMTPLYGSPAAQRGIVFEHWAAGLIGKWNVSNYDKFVDQHITAPVGEKLISQKLPHGGIVSLFFYAVVIIIVIAIVIAHLYNNTSELKASVPRAVVQSSFGSRFQVHSTIVVETTVTGIVREYQQISTMEGACLKYPSTSSTYATASATDRLQCRPHTTATPSNIEIGTDAGEQPYLECRYHAATTSCAVRWICPHCYIPEGSTGSVTIATAPQAVGAILDTTVTTTTGIRSPVLDTAGGLSMNGGANEVSTVTQRVAPSNKVNVLTGSPASEFYFALTPTYFEASELAGAIDSSAEPFRATGYHVRKAQDPKAGNEVKLILVQNYFDAPITINLSVDNIPLLIKRTFTQSIVQLIISLLGALAGVGGLALAVTQFIDTQTGINTNSWHYRHDTLEDDDDIAGLQMIYESVDIEITEDEYRLLQPIINLGVPPHKAAAFLQMLRRKRTLKREELFLEKERERQELERLTASFIPNEDLIRAIHEDDEKHADDDPLHSFLHPHHHHHHHNETQAGGGASVGNEQQQLHHHHNNANRVDTETSSSSSSSRSSSRSSSSSDFGSDEEDDGGHVRRREGHGRQNEPTAVENENNDALSQLARMLGF